MNPIVSRIRIYPIKSLDCMEVDEVIVGKGVLLHDREFAMLDEEGKFINGKRTPRVNLLRTEFGPGIYSVAFHEEGQNSEAVFDLLKEKENIECYLSDFFGYRVFLDQNNAGQFLDVPGQSGITICSESSINSLCRHFPDISVEEMRSRFRANIEITNVPEFWEDHLFAEPGDCVEYYLGNVKLYGITPRARCIVPTRDPLQTKPYPYFTKKFVSARKETLPGWSLLSEYKHFYFFSVDTFIPDSEEGKKISRGDELVIAGKRDLSEVKI